MSAATTLEAYLNSYRAANGGTDSARGDIAAVISGLAKASVQIRNLINQGALGTAFAGKRGSANADGDIQRDLDVVADDMFLSAMRECPVALYASEELDNPVLLSREASLAIAIDPLDGSSNIDTNVSIGTIFSILPVAGDPAASPVATFMQPGTSQLASGFFIYGPQLALVLTLGQGTAIFVFSTRLGSFVQAYKSVSIPEEAREFAVNASNYRHWDGAVRCYVDDCLAGCEGPRECDFNMRWIASLVADTYRILIRGGVFLYPGDGRKNYAHGRLRLVYEANPIAFLVEQAGGAATDTTRRILEIVPESLHQRTPLVHGSKKEVIRIGRYHSEPGMISERSPLFGKRGLFRA
ncbi:MAG: class 1 fructose-bisphosphatase [Nitratireductor sp.]|nr:class 1 fructose-bisphosphatase [Nitratireductor sp.]